jgi:hypothetical protein
LLLVNAFRILLKKEVSQSEIQNAKILIHKFISEIPHLYGEEQCTYNVHVLQHIPDSVNNWGAPWASSSFLYEDLGRILKSFFHGTTYLGEQIFNSFLAKQQLREYARSFIPLAEEGVRDLYGKLDSQVGSDYSSYSANHSIPTPLGKKILIKLTVSEVLAIETKYRIILNCVNAFSYQRFGLNGKMYSTKSYSTQFKRQNCVICDVKGNGLEIKNVVQLQVNCKCMLNLGAGCILQTSPAAHSFIILCDNLSLNPIAPSIERHSRVNLNGFLKVVQ